MQTHGALHRVHQGTMRGFCLFLFRSFTFFFRFPSIPIRLPTCFITFCFVRWLFFALHTAYILRCFSFLSHTCTSFSSSVVSPVLCKKRVNRLGLVACTLFHERKRKSTNPHGEKKLWKPTALATEIHFTVQPPSPTISLLPPNVPRTSSGRLRSGLSTAVLAPF